MAKIRVNISMDEQLVSLARSKGFNISGLCEDAIREILLSFEKQTLPEDCTHRWTFPFSATFGLAKECLKCHTIQKVQLESYEETMARCKA